MKSLILLAFLIGDCAVLIKGPFKGSYWTVTAVNQDGTFDLKDREWVLRDVKGSYLGACK